VLLQENETFLATHLKKEQEREEQRAKKNAEKSERAKTSTGLQV
jgi:hypothetical protein